MGGYVSIIPFYQLNEPNDTMKTKHVIVITTILILATQCGSREQTLINDALASFEKNLVVIEGGSRKCESKNVYLVDLDNNSTQDAIVHFYWELTDGGNLGGSGFALFLNNGNELQFKGTQDNALNFSPKVVIGNELVGEMKEYGPDDPRCCPSQISSANLILENGKLIISKK